MGGLGAHSLVLLSVFFRSTYTNYEQVFSWGRRFWEAETGRKKVKLLTIGENNLSN
jgi:hypothetical protein